MLCLEQRHPAITGADAGAGVDLNAGEGTAYLAEAAGGQFQGQAAGPEAMADSVQADRLEAGIAAHDLQPAAGSRITLANDREVGTDVIKHRRRISWRRPEFADQSPYGANRSYRC